MKTEYVYLEYTNLEKKYCNLNKYTCSNFSASSYFSWRMSADDCPTRSMGVWPYLSIISW